MTEKHIYDYFIIRTVSVLTLTMFLTRLVCCARSIKGRVPTNNKLQSISTKQLIIQCTSKQYKDFHIRNTNLCNISFYVSHFIPRQNNMLTQICMRNLCSAARDQINNKHHESITIPLDDDISKIARSQQLRRMIKNENMCSIKINPITKNELIRSYMYEKEKPGLRTNHKGSKSSLFLPDFCLDASELFDIRPLQFPEEGHHGKIKTAWLDGIVY